MTTTAPTTIDSKKPNTKQELIAANIKLLIEQLEAGHSDALTNYLTAMSRFHNYSFGNILEIARQIPTATRVAGFWTWKNLPLPWERPREKISPSKRQRIPPSTDWSDLTKSPMIWQPARSPN